MSLRPVAILLLPIFGGCAPSSTDEGSDVEVPSTAFVGIERFYTRGMWEPDKLSSGWLLTRKLVPGSQVMLVDEGQPNPADAVAYDLADARWARDGVLSTFEVILRDEGLNDPVLVKMGRLVRASELSSWMLEPGTPEHRFDRGLKELALAADPESTFAWLDRLYAAGGDLDQAPPPIESASKEGSIIPGR